MPTVTGLTAARMQEIVDDTIVGAAINGSGHLILTKHDGTQVDAGSAAGPPGIQGLPGPTSIAVVTSSTRPTGGALFLGLMIYETDTKRRYQWDGAAWQYVGGVIICTSTTRPTTGLFPGLEIYETDTARKLTYQSATTGWTPPWDTAWGLIDFKNRISPQTGITTVVDATGLSSTLTYLQNRRIKLTGSWGAAFSSVAGDSLVVSLKEGATILNQKFRVLGTGQGEGGDVRKILVPTAASHSYRVTYERLLGSGSITIDAQSWYEAYLSVEDIGPAGPPA